MKKGSSAIIKVMRGTGAVSKVMRGIATAWENWSYKTGNFYVMSSANTPSPFVASDYSSGFNLRGNPFQVFDANDGTYRYGEANNSGQIIGANLSFGKNIKIQNVYARVDSGGGSFSYSFNVFVDAYDAVNGIWRNLYDSGNIGAGTNVAINIPVNTAYEFSQIRVYARYNSGATLGLWWVNSCQVTQWFEKG